ncbi:MAG: type I methionyl aminopeptidase [Jiangellaceae bacterium]
MIEIKTAAEIEKMRVPGLVVGEILAILRNAVEPGVTPLDIDAIARRELEERGATSNFLGYGGFPATACISVNDVVVHGIPNGVPFRAGDVVSIDFGAVVDGWHGDAAVTVPVADVSDEVAALLRACEDSLWAGIAAMQNGGRLRDIGAAVEDLIHAQGTFGILEEYGGHGIGTAMHQDPHVMNYRTRARGPKLVPGLCLAVEPMITMGSPQTYTLDDHWTVKTADGSWSAHFEHSIAITEHGPWVLTALDGGAERLTALGIPTPATTK